MNTKTSQQNKNIMDSSFSNPQVAKLVSQMGSVPSTLTPITQRTNKSSSFNLMKLMGKSHKLDSNIFSITVGQILTKDTYKKQLQVQASKLRMKLQAVKGKDIGLVKTNILPPQQNSRGQMCGKIYDKKRLLSSKYGVSNTDRWNPPLQNEYSKSVDVGTQQRRLFLTKQLQNEQQQQCQPKNILDQILPKLIPGLHSQVYSIAQRRQLLHKQFTDNFKEWSQQILSIPEQFPYPHPVPSNSQEQNKCLLQCLLMKMKQSPCKSDVVVRRYRNCLMACCGKQVLVWYYNGYLYLGGWNFSSGEMGEKEGSGFEYSPNHYIYRGYFAGGQRDGQGVIKLLRECKIYAGEWKQGKAHGRGRCLDKDGSEYIGDFVEDQRLGLAKIKHSHGGMYEGNVVGGSKCGKGVDFMPNGDTYEGEFDKGLFHGRGVYVWSNGSRYEGWFSKGMRHGKGVWESKNGEKYVGEYNNDKKEGKGRYSWGNGEVYEGQFVQDLREGEGYYSYSNGKIAKFLWEKGVVVKKLYSREEDQYRMRRISKTSEKNI